MADPASYRPRTSDIPTDPGVYKFRDEVGRVVYVGKAKNLRNRLNSYFAAPGQLAPKTYAMVHTAASVEWTVVGSELESLQLEYTWIKQFTPRFNIMYRDDKTYPYLAVSMADKYPRAQVMRGRKKKGTRYFGPFSHAWAIRETLDALLRVFPVRTCTRSVFQWAEQSGRPCLLGYIDKCSAPCVGRISEADHRALAEGLCRFMAGDSERYIRELTGQMEAAAEAMQFEHAAKLRDDISALRKAFERNAVVLAESLDADLFAFDEDDLEAAAQVFHVRGGRIRGQRGWIVEKVEDLSDPQMVEQLLQQVYGESAVALASTPGDHDVQENEIPRNVLVPVLPENAEQLEEWLSGLRGSRVRISVPQRGERVQLMGTVAENAKQALKLHKSRRAGDLTTRSASLQQLQEALDLDEPLMRIECYDISHVQGTNVVASMVVFEDGLPRKGEYRKFSIRGEAARDDTASMYDVIRRRFTRHLEEQRARQEAAAAGEAGGEVSADASEKERRKFAYPPNLVVVDGGPPQVAAARQALDDLGVLDVHVVGLAKRLEEIWVPDDEFPVILPRGSEGLFLLQRLRDEAHRFAITFHRSKRGKAMIASGLDGIPGLGKAKKDALVQHFGTFRDIRAADAEALQEVPGIGPALAEKIVAHLAEDGADAGTEASD